MLGNEYEMRWETNEGHTSKIPFVFSVFEYIDI